MRTAVLAFSFFVCSLFLNTAAFAQQPIPNNDTRGLVDSLLEGRPFGQASLNAIEPQLAQYCIQLTPSNAAGDRTKIGDPISGVWTRLGFGEGHWVWIPQSDTYIPHCDELLVRFPMGTPVPPLPPSPPPTLPPAQPPTFPSVDLTPFVIAIQDIQRTQQTIIQRLDALDAKVGVVDAKVTELVTTQRNVMQTIGAGLAWIAKKSPYWGPVVGALIAGRMTGKTTATVTP